MKPVCLVIGAGAGIGGSVPRVQNPVAERSVVVFLRSLLWRRRLQGL